MPVTSMTVNIIYTIYFKDQTEYNFAFGLSNSTGLLQISPADAAIAFAFVDGVNYNTPDGSLDPDRGMYGTPLTNGIPPWPGVGVEIRYKGQLTGEFFKSDQLRTQFIAPDGKDVTWVWVGVLVNTGYIEDPILTAPVPKRRWIQGFEYPAGGEGSPTVASNFTRDASRTCDGLGLALRNSNNVTITRTLSQYGAVTDNRNSWERFYIRIRTIGAAALDVWRGRGGSVSNLNGVVLKINTDGTIGVYNATAFGQTLEDTTTSLIVQDQWHKIDCLIHFNPAALGGSGSFDLYVDGLFASTISVSAGTGGLGANLETHGQTQLGTALAGANTWEVDFDDWHNAEVPKIAGVQTLTSIDWLNGTHTRKVDVDSGTTVDWTGEVQFMNQMMAPVNTPAAETLTSSIALATLEGITSATDAPDQTGLSFFAIAAIIAKHGNRAGVTDGQLGYSLAGAAPVMASITESTLDTFTSVAYLGTGLDVTPPSIVPFSILHEKANVATAANVKALSAVVQYAGAWGTEDIVNSIPFIRPQLTHNSWYPDIAWSFVGPSTVAPIAAVGGTYVGDGTTKTTTLPLPCHFLIIRPLTVATTDSKWFGSALHTHLDSQEATVPAQIIRVSFDPLTGVSSFTVTGTNATVNQNGVVYQYIAFCDPGMEYNICGAFMHATAVSAAVNLLVDSTFTPSAAFFNFEKGSASSAIRLSYKGSGHAGTTGNRLDGTALASLASFSAGAITTDSDAHAANEQTTYSAWRTGNNCADTMVQILSYTGDNAASRVITLTPTSTRYPLFAYIQPHNAVGVVRDPSDVGTASRNVDTGAPITNGIIAGGVDSLTVGITLNANGIVYDVFVICGDASGWNNGEFFGPDCFTTCLYSACIPVVPPDVAVTGNGGLELGDTTPLTLLKDVGGIYTLVPGKTYDTMYDRQTGQTSVSVKIPNPNWKTGYIGG